MTVTFTCADAESGIVTCTAPVTVSTNGAGQVITGTAVDLAGNTATTSVTLNIDKPPQGSIQGDVDGDGDVDRNDVGIIFAARGAPASGPDDMRDLDRDGVITVNDGRSAVLLCTRPRCAIE